MADSAEPEPSRPPDSSADEPVPDDDLYAVAESEEPAVASGGKPPPEQKDEADAPTWYVGMEEGRREGPFSLAVIKQRILSGEVTRGHLVWRSGMSGWTPAGEVSALFPQSAGPPPLHARESHAEEDAAAERWQAASAAVMRRCDSIFNRPIFFRVFGRVSAVLGLCSLLIALIAAMADKGNLFVYVFWFALLFLVGEATAAILDGLDRGRRGDEQRRGDDEGTQVLR